MPFFVRLFAKLGVDFKQYAATAVAAFRLKMSEYFSYYMHAREAVCLLAIREAQRFNRVHGMMQTRKSVTGNVRGDFYFTLANGRQ